MEQHTFYRIPPEIWENIIARVGRRDLPSLALTSKETYPIANIALYKILEISLCRCSELYYDALARTFLNNAELAALVAHLSIDMEINCKVKAASSFDNTTPTGSWRSFNPYALLSRRVEHSRYDTPKGQADLNREVVQTLSNPQLHMILSQLRNIQSLTLIFGHFQQNSETLSSLVNSLPVGVLSSLRCLKIYDTYLTPSSLTLATSLRVLDLGYVSADNDELCAVISRNADSLEEIRLQWIMESKQSLLFSDYPGPVVKNLKTFSSHLPYAFSLSGLQNLLGDALMLEELRLESLSIASAIVWGQRFSALTSDGHWRAQRMRIVRFGVATGCSEFWDPAAKFLDRCGNKLTSLYISGRPRGSNASFPPALLKVFANNPQPELDNLILMWHGDEGFSPESAVSLESFAPSLELFHTSLAFPFTPDPVEDLLGMISSFPKLRRCHLTFLKYIGAHGTQDYSAHFDDMVEQIENKGPIFQDFVRRAALSHPELSEVSWSVYDKIKYSGEGPKAYVKINRADIDAMNLPGLTSIETAHNPSFTLTDLGEECRRYESADLPRFRCTIGTKKVLLNQKPGWREDMGNPFIQTRRVCLHAELNSNSESRPLPRRREL